MKALELSESSEERLKILSELLKAIAHPTRLRILCLLSKEPKNVGELEEILGKEQAVVSQQLKILRFNKLVKVERHNGFSVYSVAPDKQDHLMMIMQGVCQFM